MSNSRPELETVVDVRSYERVVVISNPESSYDYPESWVRQLRANDLALIDWDTVVLVDRVDVSRKTLAVIGERGPRVFAFVPATAEQERSIRRSLTSLYPWAEVWSTYTTLGRTFFTTGLRGSQYDRDTLVDMRSTGAAA